MSDVDNSVDLSEMDKKFWKFHTDNPQVFSRFEQLAGRAYTNGVKRIGMNMLMELVRWDHLMSTNSEDFKINNSYSSRYVRILLDKHPEWRDMFEVRRMKAW